MRNLFLIALLFVIGSHLPAQELLCKVTVNADRVNTTDRGIFTDMEKAFAQFLNTRKWTNDTFKDHERITCNLFINIGEMPSIGNFRASVQVTAARPVFNSNYQSVLINFADRDWDFEYIESLPLEYNDNAFITNLTSMLAFYAYVIIGTDYDTFSELGGNPHFQKALLVVNNAQSSNRSGWLPLGSNRTRYALVESLTNPQNTEMRKALYRYHRLGLDNFSKKPDESRQIALDALKEVQKTFKINPTSILVISFFDTKAPELVNVFSEGALPVRREAFDILSAIDSKRDIYQKIMAN
jgi:hypothetical protein